MALFVTVRFRNWFFCTYLCAKQDKIIMEIDNTEYLNVDLNYPEAIVGDTRSFYLKETLMHSPLFIDIFPKFYVSLYKKIRSIKNMSLKDDDIQYAAFQEEDSQFGVFSDDEMLFDTADEDLEFVDKQNIDENIRKKLKSVQVIIKATSLLINERHFPFNSTVRSSCIVKGIRNSHIQEEDSLLVSLKSGYLLLIRLFFVPEDFNDSDNLHSDNKNMVYKPFVVQWWDTSGELAAPSLNSTGFELNAHISGLAAVSTSCSNSFRIFNCDHTENGLFFHKHHSVPIDGLILHSCFAQPIKGSVIDNHVMFLAVVLTNNNRLVLTLYSWSTSEPIHLSLSKSTLPLNGDFPLPIFTVSLGNSGSFLFVTPDELIIITVHDITSAEYNFRRIEFKGSFPTNFYRPESYIINSGDNTIDEVLISTDNGVIYSVLAQGGTFLSVRPIVRISDPISLFSFEASNEGYELIYGSYVGMNRKLFIESLLPDVEANYIPYSSSLLLNNFKNWAPIIDIQVFDAYKSKNVSQNCNQEVWCISGTGKRARLSQLRNGYHMSKVSDSFHSLRKVKAMYPIQFQGNTFICCSFPFETSLIEFQDNEEPDLVQINDIALSTSEDTLSMHTVRPDVALQITPNQVLLTSFEQILATKTIDDGSIIFGDYCNGYVLTVSQSSSSDSIFTLEISKLADDFEPLHSIPITFQISFAQLLKFQEETWVIVGTYDGTFQFSRIDTQVILSTREISLFDLIEENRDEGKLVPNEAILTVDYNNLIIGTKDGYAVNFILLDDGEPKFKDSFKLSYGDVSLHQTSDNVIMIACGSLWIMDFNNYAVPEVVLSDEKNDKAVKALIPIRLNRREQNVMVLIVREEGMSICKIDLYKSPIIKQINLGESAKRFTYLTQNSMFAITSASENRNARLRFVDRKMYKLLPHAEFNSKNKRYYTGDSIFDDDEIPTCLKVWSLDKLGRTTKKLLVGCSNGARGSFKILDVSKTTGIDEKPIAKVTQLNSFDHPDPINCIEQIETVIFFSSGRNLYSTSYNLDERRLNPVISMATLTSDITSMTNSNSLLTITTKLDSVFQFKYSSSASYNECLQLFAKDPSPKSIVNHAILNDEVIITDKVHSDILVMTRSIKDLVPSARFKLSGVPRVLSANLDSFWKTDSSKGILAATVNGSLTFFKKVTKNSRELKELESLVPMKVNPDGDHEFSTDRWDLPFKDKVGGKGLKAINKAYFRNIQNKTGIIDYDLPEISKLCFSYNSL